MLSECKTSDGYEMSLLRQLGHMQRKNDGRTSKQPYDGEMNGLREIEDRQSIASWS